MRATKFLSSLGLSLLFLLGNTVRHVVSQTCTDSSDFSSQFLVEVISDQPGPYDFDDLADFEQDFWDAYVDTVDEFCADDTRNIVELNATAGPSVATDDDRECGAHKTTITVSVSGDCTQKCTGLFGTDQDGGVDGKKDGKKDRILGQRPHKGRNGSRGRVLEECDTCPDLSKQEEFVKKLKKNIKDRYAAVGITPFCDIGDGGAVEFQALEGCTEAATTEDRYWTVEIEYNCDEQIEAGWSQG